MVSWIWFSLAYWLASFFLLLPFVNCLKWLERSDMKTGGENVRGEIQKVIVLICRQSYLVTYRSWPSTIFGFRKMIYHNILLIDSHFLINYCLFIEKVYTGLCITWSMQYIKKLQIVDEKHWNRIFKQDRSVVIFSPNFEQNLLCISKSVKI